MTDEPNEIRAVLSTGKTLKLGDESWAVSRDDARVEYVDLICEARHFNGVVSMSFAQAIIDAGGSPEAHICTRLRMNMAVAQGLHAMLGQMIADALNPSGKTKSN